MRAHILAISSLENIGMLVIAILIVVPFSMKRLPTVEAEFEKAGEDFRRR